MLTRHFDDLNFTVLAVEHSHYVDFTVLDVQGKTSGGRPLYQPLNDAPANPDGYADTTQPEFAVPYLHGSVKWDGCSDWHFDAQDDCMLHGCSRQDVQRFGHVLGRCWDWASELMGPKFG